MRRTKHSNLKWRALADERQRQRSDRGTGQEPCQKRILECWRLVAPLESLYEFVTEEIKRFCDSKQKASPRTTVSG
jgi:hypothetical protein